ncbi:hypothetical protein GYMLUDRAFT_582036 [Collybiopsis luxurians FD-317 M1]|uniref:Velvet domain-containing protein n=1 Tax=Collybiopsis luxurians FD-317 M1 TaxID=944289 RepID=A0A0D0CFL4_9AGAR|nr:hypothetical protein GYMLUDRAFT_582036 [Collybiopsis luxurians FD-317 M1]
MYTSGSHSHHIHHYGGGVYQNGPQQQITDDSFSSATGQCSSPISFECGQFTGKVIRSELCEIQKADLGRKYARVDRRPLDPPPVVKLRFFEVLDSSERELTYEEIQILGLLCTVDLFPVITSDTPSGSPGTKNGHKKSNSSASSTSTASSGHYSPISYDTHGYTPGSSVHNLPLTSSSVYSSRFSHSHHSPPVPSDIVHWCENVPITESSKMTDALVGAKFVQPQFIDYEGTRTLVFVFSDLAVKNEGTFLLRYRSFDLFSRAQGQTDHVIQAECYGGPFRVYSTKEFPGLQASTELTKLISRYGVRLNIRETERKRRKKDSGGEGSSSPQIMRGKRKHDRTGLSDDED